MTTITDLSTATPVEVDTELADLYAARRDAWEARTSTMNAIQSKVGSREWIRATGRSKGYYRNNLTNDDALAELRRRIAATQAYKATPRTGDSEVDYQAYRALELAPHELDTAEHYVDELGRLDDELERIDARWAELSAEYLRRPWSRFFRVVSSDGHIHRSMTCSTCYGTTRYGWHPELSSKTEPEAVELLGPALCTICFPSAPVAWTSARLTKTGKISKAAR